MYIRFHINRPYLGPISHSGILGNEKVDKVAKQATLNQRYLNDYFLQVSTSVLPHQQI